MISKLVFKFGSQDSIEPLQLEPTALTIFVGPNNSGKSLILREIEQFSVAGTPGDIKALDKIDYNLPEKDEARELVLSKSDAPPRHQALRAGQVWMPGVKLGERRISSTTFTLEAALRLIEERSNWQSIATYLLSRYTIRLDGRSRFELTDPQPTGDLLKRPTNHLMALFRDDEARTKLRNITADAFGLYFTIDPTGMQKFRIRMADREPEDQQEEQGLNNRARVYHAQAEDIADLSDGLKAFTGLASIILSSDFRIILIDEPEAFLHPPLARKLGYTITNFAFERQARVFAATHSSDFLMGCIQAGQQVNIVRLTYKNGVATAHLLAASQLQTLMRDPLLRSTGVLSALFYEGVIVTEGDSDRAFYQEVNLRLQAADSEGATGCVFLNAQNKSTVGRIVSPLREMGVPAVAIVDLDIIKKKDDFKKLLSACNVPPSLAESWGNLRGQLYRTFQDQGVDPKEKGIHDLSPIDRETASTLLDSLAVYGIFVVPDGAVESWLRDLGISGPKKKWLPAIFERMGANPDDTDYVLPTEGDVWDFIRSVGRWIADPHRKGMARLTSTTAEETSPGS